MSLNNIKITKKNDGFTIVELLIVIVVIGILAAITLVSYNGVQNRAKASSAQSLANNIAKKAETWNAIKSGYPTQAQLVAGDTTVPEAKLDSTAVFTTNGATAPTNEKAVQYQVCGTNKGVKVIYFTAPSGTATVLAGDTSGTCA